MGFNVNGVRALCYAKKLGVDFSKSAMLGRQGLYLTPQWLSRVFRGAGIVLDQNTVDDIFHANHGYSEQLLACLGAKEVDSFDASAYEGATQVHDFNLAIPDRFQQKYSLVVDSGTLEHVFNFPMALKNCMEMVSEGGHLIILTPVNNFMGHGFYQFAPETFSCVLNKQNGYCIVKMVIFEDASHARWFEVAQPEAVNGRVTLCNRRPTYLLVIAKRMVTIDAINMSPQQSDYVVTWNQKGEVDSLTRGVSRFRFLNVLKRCVPPQIRAPVWKIFVNVFCGGYDVRFYKRILRLFPSVD